MISLPRIGLLAAMVLAAQDPGEMPKAWEQKYEAAAKEVKAGAFARAEVLMLDVVGEAEKLGAQDLRLATPLETLAGFYLTRKRFAEAEPLLRRALAIREKIQGPAHTDVARTLVSLALAQIIPKGKDAQTAAPLVHRAVAIIEKARGKDSPDLAYALQGLSSLHMSRKEIDEAERVLMRLLAIRGKASGQDSLEVATVLDDLGDLYTLRLDAMSSADMEARVMGEPKEKWPSEEYGKKAEDFYKRALAIREKALRPDHPDIVDSLYNLGQLAEERRRPADGEKYMERWLKLQEAAKAPASERQAKALMMLAGASMERKDWAEADRRFAKAQGIIEGLHGVESNDASMTLAARFDVACEAGRFGDAETFLRRNLEIQSAMLGPDDRDIVEARALMAGSYRDHVEDRRAQVLWRRLRVLENRSEGKRHWNLCEILSGYANLLRRTNRVLPQPTEEDLAYLKKAGAMIPAANLEFLMTRDSLLDSGLDDEGLKHIARLYDLQQLRLRGITDAGLPHIKGLLNLRELDLSNSQVTDAGLAHLIGLENLERLDVKMTHVDDAGLSHLKGLKNLQDLHLAYTDVTDAGLKTLEEIKSLRKLNLGGTRITNEGVMRLRRARPDLHIEHEPGPGFMQLVVPVGFKPDAPPDAAVPARPAPAVPALPPSRLGKP